MNLGKHPQPVAPWRPLIFRVHCLVTERWMKIRVPFNWFWFGDQEYGTPEVESGSIASTTPRPPNLGPRMPAADRTDPPGPTLPEDDLVPYQTPSHRKAETLEEKVDRLEQLASSAYDSTHQQGYGR